MSQIVFAAVFIAALAYVFLKERKRRLQFEPTAQQINAHLPQLVKKAVTLYEAKHGRPPSIVESLKR